MPPEPPIIRDPLHAREVDQAHQLPGDQLRQALHRPHERRALLGVIAIVLEDALAEDLRRLRLARFDGVGERPPWRPVALPGLGDCHVAHRPRDVGAQGLSDRGQREPIVVVMLQDADAGRRSHDPKQRARVCSYFTRQRVGAPRPIDQNVAYAQAGEGPTV